jgi:hypothetical protein
MSGRQTFRIVSRVVRPSSSQGQGKTQEEENVHSTEQELAASCGWETRESRDDLGDSEKSGRTETGDVW